MSVQVHTHEPPSTDQKKPSRASLCQSRLCLPGRGSLSEPNAHPFSEASWPGVHPSLPAKAEVRGTLGPSSLLGA